MHLLYGDRDCLLPTAADGAREQLALCGILYRVEADYGIAAAYGIPPVAASNMTGV